MERIKSFSPIICKDSRVLILGSMPGVMSLNRCQYYAHERNHFWKIIFALFNEEEEEDYINKVAFLKAKKIALWDVINSCYREGSLDTNIRKEEANDIGRLLKNYPNLKFVGFNGSKAFTTFKKHIGLHALEGLHYLQLPSTSPIPGRNIKSLEDKLNAWSVIINYL